MTTRTYQITPLKKVEFKRLTNEEATELDAIIAAYEKYSRESIRLAKENQNYKRRENRVRFKKKILSIVSSFKTIVVFVGLLLPLAFGAYGVWFLSSPGTDWNYFIQRNISLLLSLGLIYVILYYYAKGYLNTKAKAKRL